MEPLGAGLRTGLVALALFVGFIVVAIAQEKAEAPPNPECPNCATIAIDYGRAWENFQELFREEGDLQKKAEQVWVDFQKAYFRGDQAELDSWAKDASVIPTRLAELPARLEKAQKEVDARHDVLLNCLRLNCFSIEQRPPPPSERSIYWKPTTVVEADRTLNRASIRTLLADDRVARERRVYTTTVQPDRRSMVML